MPLTVNGNGKQEIFVTRFSQKEQQSPIPLCWSGTGKALQQIDFPIALVFSQCGCWLAAAAYWSDSARVMGERFSTGHL